MARSTFLVMSFEGGKKVGDTPCQTRKAAIDRATHRYTGEAGAVAFEVNQASDGSYKASIIGQYGDVPNDLSKFFRG